MQTPFTKQAVELTYVFWPGEEADFEALKYQPALSRIRSTNLY